MTDIQETKVARWAIKTVTGYNNQGIVCSGLTLILLGLCSFMLQPFIHQVGGHSSMLCLDDTTVCKPVVEREKQFYETLPVTLQSFAPHYHGVIKVFLLKDDDYITLGAVAPNKYTPKVTSSIKRLRFRRNGSIETEGIDAIFAEDQAVNGLNFSNGTTSMNPWVLKCHREYLASLAAKIEKEKSPLHFLVLENLTWMFSLPCILDLKMGTRQYGDNANLAKKQSKMVKVVTTTSGKLGVRIGGMQVYQATTGHFLCRNKFYGRALTTAGFHSALQHFLHDGARLRVDILPPLIRRLEELASTLTKLESVRLYTTSLLLLYEGERITHGKISVERNRGRTSESTMPEEMKVERCSSAERLSGGEHKVPLHNEDEFRLRSTSCDRTFKHSRERRVPMEVMAEEPLTDVRIIDFAHSTNDDMNDSVTYSGPDSGFLFGLENILHILREIHKDGR